MKEKRSMKKLMMTTMLVTAGILVIGGTSSQAALQANSSTHAAKTTKTGASWIEEIRKMEATGQTMGLNEDDINEDLSPKKSNNIDVHMMRTTEYGAVAILSVSGYGNPKELSASTIKSTTGNVTGVYMGDRWEWTAGLCFADTVGKNARYYDLYTTSNTSAKVGDALGTASTTNPGCAGWHGNTAYTDWLRGDSRGFCRGAYGVFSFDGYGNTWTRDDWCGRGVAVVKEGI